MYVHYITVQIAIRVSKLHTQIQYASSYSRIFYTPNEDNLLIYKTAMFSVF